MASNINYDEIGEFLKNGLSVNDIAAKLEISPITALDRVRTYKKKMRDNALFGTVQNNSPNVAMDFNNSELTPLPRERGFDLGKGDTVMAIVGESGKRERCEVISVCRHIYTVQTLNGHKIRASFQKKAYRMGFDPGKVELLRKRKC